MVRSARRGMIGRTHGRGAGIACDAGAGIGGGKAAGDEISIACGELFWVYTRSARERTPHGAWVGSAVDGDGAENGSSCKTSSEVVTARGRGGQWAGESSEEMDMDEPNEWSSSCGRHPSRATGDDKRCGSSMPQAAGASCGEERIAAMITPTYPRSATETRGTKQHSPQSTQRRKEQAPVGHHRIQFCQTRLRCGPTNALVGNSTRASVGSPRLRGCRRGHARGHARMRTRLLRHMQGHVPLSCHAQAGKFLAPPRALAARTWGARWRSFGASQA